MHDPKKLINEVTSAPAMGFLAVADSNNQLVISRHYAFKYHEESSVFTVYSYSKDAQLVLEHLSVGKKIAAVSSDATNFNTLQFKGSYLRHYPVEGAEELAFVEQNNQKQMAIMEMFGIGQMFKKWHYLPSTAIVFTVEEIFEQSPRTETGKQISI